ncbi:hypothetical protein SAY87_027961 [Trapa incisa]|uniref:DUF868 family protein n=1 Tax=Trapa incisa TaxID=236973 RepID=A0AAN7L1Q0_9MYRT|nr:hypothetical protein SAY87_027961 [Trapa incisa]
MRSIATCYSEHAIRVSDSYCSGPSSSSVQSSLPRSVRSMSSSGPIEITSTYRIKLSSGKQLLISLTWQASFLRQGFIIEFSDRTSREIPLGSSPRRLRKSNGSKSFQFSDTTIDVSWDLTFARYDSGPEPVSGFYVVVQADSEVVLFLGDACSYSEKRNGGGDEDGVEFALVSRREQFLGGTAYSTRVIFGGTGPARAHDVLIKCGQDDGNGSPALTVFVDGKKMFRVQRLRWNFRGNQTIFVDGLLIDTMWDVHDWFFGAGIGCAMFFFRTRSGLDSRLWLEEENLQRNEVENTEFSLMICACNSNSSPNG